MTEERRKTERRRTVRRRSGAPTPDSLAAPAVEIESIERLETKPRKGGVASFAAQILGQGGQKRGLKGGRETLDKARATYLGTEWSGHADRRPRPGRITKTDV